jgi:organic hydroperoxide reductase OsmC/OhrA
MDPFPHLYTVTAAGAVEGAIQLSAESLSVIESAAPAEFGGPGNLWSPETLLMASVANCFVLTFRAVAGASKFEWLGLTCESSGTLERIERVTRFTEIVNRVSLKIPHGTSEQSAIQLLRSTEGACLIGNSLSAAARLEPSVVFG